MCILVHVQGIRGQKKLLFCLQKVFKTTTPGSFQMLSIARKKKRIIMFAYYLFTPVVFLMKLLFTYSKVYLLTSSWACEWSVFWTSTDSLPSPFTVFSLRVQPCLLTLGRQGRFTGKIPSSEERRKAAVFAGYVQRLTWSCGSATQPRHAIRAAHVT